MAEPPASSQSRSRLEPAGLLAAALAILIAPVLQTSPSHPLSLRAMGLTVLWSASVAGFAWIRRAGLERANRRMGLWVAITSPVFGSLIAVSDGLPPMEIVAFLAPLPLLYAAFVRQHVKTAASGAIATLLCCAVLSCSGVLPAAQAVRTMFFVTLTSSFAVYSSFVFRRARTLEVALAEERQSALRREAEETRARADLERRSMESERLATVGRLAAGVAHEVNNPLAFIRSNLGYVREELARSGANLPGDLFDSLDESLTGVNRIQSIVTDLKSLAREQPEGEVTDAVDALREAIRLASVGVRSRIEVVVLSPPSGQVDVLIGRGRLVQVLLNLLLNSMDALASHPAGKVFVSVERSEATRVRLYVEDDGPGIPSDVLPRLFQPFFTTKPVGKGTGLGLWLSRQYVQRCGGSITAGNRDEGGARFTVELSAIPAQARVELVSAA